MEVSTPSIISADIPGIIASVFSDAFFVAVEVSSPVLFVVVPRPGSLSGPRRVQNVSIHALHMHGSESVRHPNRFPSTVEPTSEDSSSMHVHPSATSMTNISSVHRNYFQLRLKLLQLRVN